MRRMDEPFRICRDTGVVLTARAKDRPQAKAFVEFFSARCRAKNILEKRFRCELGLTLPDGAEWRGSVDGIKRGTS